MNEFEALLERDKQREEEERRREEDIARRKADFAVEAQGAPPFDPEGDSYDYTEAVKGGAYRDETGHASSRNPKTGQILKGRGHETFDLAVKEDVKQGYVVYKDKDGKYYSQKPSAVPFDVEIIDQPAQYKKSAQAAKDMEQHLEEVTQAGLRHRMSQGIISAARNFAYNRDEMYGNIPEPTEPLLRAGKFGAFMQGVSQDREDLFGRFGEGEPHGIVEHGLKFAGTLLPLVAGTAFLRVPFGYAMAQAGLEGTLASIAAEIGGGAVGADVPFVLLQNKMSTNEKFGTIALGVFANALLPGSMQVKQIARTFVHGGEEGITYTGAKMAAKEFGKEGYTKQGNVYRKFESILDQATEGIEASKEEVTPNFLKPDQFQSAVVKDVVRNSDSYGEAILDSFTEVTNKIRENVDSYVLEQQKRLDGFRLTPEEVVEHVNQNINAEVDRLFNYAGHLTPKEEQIVYNSIKNEAWHTGGIDPQVLANEIRVRNGRKVLDYETAANPEDAYDQRLFNSAVEVKGKNGAIKKVDQSLPRFQERVDDMIGTLQQVDNNAYNRLRPFTSDKERERLFNLFDEVETNINTAWQREEVKQLKQDLDQIVSLMGDPNLPFNVGEGYAMKARGLPEAIITAAEIYKARPDILEAQLKALTEAITKGDEAAGIRYRDALREVEKYRHQLEHEQVDAVLKAYTMGEEIPKINSMSVYNAAKESIKQMLRGTPEFADLATEVEQVAKFMPPEQSKPMIDQLNAQLDEEVGFILGDWDTAVKAMDADPLNHKLEKAATAYHAATGNPAAVDKVQFINNQAGHQRMAEPMAYMSADSPAHVEPSAGAAGYGKKVEGEISMPDRGVRSGENPYSPADFDPSFNRAKVGSGFISRNLGSFFANIGVYKREVEKLGDEEGIKIMNELEKEINDFRSAYNIMADDIGKKHEQFDNLFNGWRKDRTLEGATQHVVYEVSKQANKMEREGATPETIVSWIDDYVAKQSADVQREYGTFRGYMNDQFTELQNAVLGINQKYNINIPVPVYRPGYMHFAYEGEFLVKFSNGTVIPVADSAGLAKALNELVERGVNFDDLSYQIVPLWSDVVEDFSLADKVLKDGSAFGITHKQLKDIVATQGKFTPDTVMKAVWGGMEERMLSLEKSKKGLYSATAISTRLSTRYVHMIEPTIRMRQMFNKLQKAGFINVAEEVKVWANDVMGISRNAEHNWDKQFNKIHDYINVIPGARYIADSFGMNEGARPLRSAVNMLASVGRMLSIGFNPMTALLQTTIAPMNIFPLVGMRNYFKSLRELDDFFVDGRWSALARKSNIHLRQIGKSGSGFLDQMRISKPRVTQTGLEYALDRTGYASMFMFNGVENVVRLASLKAAVKDAEQKSAKIIAGKAGKSHTYKLLNTISKQLDLPVSSPTVHDEYAYRMLEVMNFDFNTTGLNQLARNPFFKLPMQFKTYFFQEMEFIMGRKIPLTATERFKTIGAMVALGGIASLPFADELDDVMTWMTGKSPKLWMYENLPDVIAAGFPALANINMSPLMSVGGTRSLALFPGIEGVLLNKLRRAYTEKSTGQKTALQAILGMSSLFRNFTEGWEMAHTGKILSPGGTAVVRRGGKLAAFGEALGIQTTQNTVSNELQSYYSSIKRGISSQRTSDRKRILGSLNPYRKGKELGYDREQVKQMLDNANETRIEQSPKAQKTLGVEGD